MNQDMLTISVTMDQAGLKSLREFTRMVEWKIAQKPEAKTEVKEVVAEVEAEVVAAPEVKAEEPKPEKKKKEKKITIEMVRAALNAKAKKDGFAAALDIVKDCGADNVTELQEQFYARAIELCSK
jgi:hypothetical protein